jgi:ribonuclease HI
MSEPVLPHWTLRCDGGSRGNPGPGALGYVLIDPRGREVEARGEALGVVTNNVAEYQALIAGLEAAARHGIDRLVVCMDSELVVRQLRGEYRVKHPGLKELHQKAITAAGKIGHVRYREVPRTDNARADRLVNDTLDEVLGTGTGRGTESPR